MSGPPPNMDDQISPATTTGPAIGSNDPALDHLTAAQARVIGALMEKEMVTPDSYPLTLRSLVSACNQTTSRVPVVDYAETLVDTTLHALKAKRLVRFVHPSHGERVTKYRQVISETLGLDDAERAVVTLLLLRGPQTVSELRTRSERMHRFTSIDEVEATLDDLSSRESPLVTRVARQPGQKGERWIQLLEADPIGRSTTDTLERPAVDPDASTRTHRSSSDRGVRTLDTSEQVAALEARVTRLEAQLERLATALGEKIDDGPEPATGL